MKNQEEGMEKLLTIEKTISGMIELHRLVVELKELETQQQKTIEVLRASEKKYRTFLENIPHRLFIKDKNFFYIYCSENYAKDLKIRPEEIAGKTDYDFFPSDLAQKYSSDDKRIVETGNLETIEDRYVAEDQGFIVHMVKAPIRDEKGNIIGILGIFWDITEQKRKEEESRKYSAHLEELLSERTAELQKTNERLQEETTERNQLEKALQRSEEKHRSFVENAPIGIQVIQDGMLKLVNPKSIEIFGYSQEELISRSLSEFIHPDDREGFEFQIRRWNEGEPPRVFSFRIAYKDGNIRWLENRFGRIHWEERPAIINFMTDITLRKQAEDELIHSVEPLRSLVKATEKILSAE